jgi:hypothetical protein
MQKVRTIRDHQNPYGDKFKKSEGDEYEAPTRAVRQLVADGLVERTSGDDDESEGDRAGGAGSGAGGTAEGDGKERSAPRRPRSTQAG